MTFFLLAAACNGPDPDETSGSPKLLVDAELEFPDVEIGSDGPRVATLWVENIGYGLLTVDVSNFDEDDAFSVVDESVTLRRMEAYGYAVTFDPRTPFLHEGSLVIDSDDPHSSRRWVAVRGEAFAPVLDVVSRPIDFLTTDVGCAAQQAIEVRNDGNEPLVVTPSLVGSYEITLGSEEPFTIEPSTSAPIVLTHRPADVGPDSATLTVKSNDPVNPAVAVALTAVGRAQEVRTDVFETKRVASDIVFVVDDSDSMGSEQEHLQDQIGTFVEELDDADVDYQIGVISTDSPELYGPVTVPGDAPSVLREQVEIGTGGSGTQRALQMLYECAQAGNDCSAESGFLREDALFVGIIVSDEPDQSALTPESYVDYFDTLKDADPDLVRIHAIAGHIPDVTCATCASPGFGYDTAVALTLGSYFDICADDWSDLMRVLADQSHVGTPGTVVQLSGDPVDHTIEVSVDGLPWGGGWTYTGRIADGGTNEVAFFDRVPAPAVVEVKYTVTSTCD